MRGLSGHLCVQCISGGGVPGAAFAFGTLGAQAVPGGSPCVYSPAGSLTPGAPRRRQFSHRVNRFGRCRLKESAWNPQQPILQPRKVAKNHAGNARIVYDPVRGGRAQREARHQGMIQDGHDADHALDLQFGGKDELGNIRSTPSRVNRSVGGQGNGRRRHPDGTPIRRFIEDE